MQNRSQHFKIVFEAPKSVEKLFHRIENIGSRVKTSKRGKKGEMPAAGEKNWGSYGFQNGSYGFQKSSYGF